MRVAVSAPTPPTVNFEEISSALVVSPRGSNTAIAGGLAAGEIGARWSNRHRGAAEDAGLVVKRSCGLALTNGRLLTLDLAISMMGGIKEVRKILSEVPIDRVDTMQSKWNVPTVSAGGSEFKPPERSARCG